MWLSIQEASTKLNVSVDTIRRWEKKGLIKAERTDKNYRIFNEEEICALSEKLNHKQDDNFQILKSGNPSPYTAIELFAGAGGTALGFENAGIRHLLLNEINSDCIATLKYNFPAGTNILPQDVHTVNFSAWQGKADIVQAGFPCQAFSYAGERIGVACIGDKLFHRHYADLDARYEGLPFGLVYSTRMLYALSSGTSHSAQYAMAAMLKAAADGTYDFRAEISVYGERARKMKDIFKRHGFYIVYDKDLDEDIADGFYFTIGYPGMTGGELAHELMYYGVSAICLVTTGSRQNGLRVCTSFVEDRQLEELDRRMAVFHENNPR